MARSVGARDKVRPKTEADRLVRPVPEPRRDLWICAILFLATLAVYFPVRHHEFILHYDLASAGLAVQVFDEKLAWEKPCGGGLTHKAYTQYPFLIDNDIPKRLVTETVL